MLHYQVHGTPHFYLSDSIWHPSSSTPNSVKIQATTLFPGWGRNSGEKGNTSSSITKKVSQNQKELELTCSLAWGQWVQPPSPLPTASIQGTQHKTHEQMLYMCNTNPLLHDLGSLLCFEFLAIQDSVDNTVGNCIELRDGGSDGKCHVLVFFPMPSRPDASQAMVGHNFLEEFLEWNRGA